jgi:hypothetical protein
LFLFFGDIYLIDAAVVSFPLTGICHPVPVGEASISSVTHRQLVGCQTSRSPDCNFLECPNCVT